LYTILAHLLECTKIIESCPSLADNYDVDIFGDVLSQLKATYIFKDVFDAKLILDENVSSI